MGETLGLCSNYNFVIVVYFFKSLITLLSIIVPIALIIFASVDFVKAVMVNDDERKKLQSLAIKRFVYAAIFFFVPTIIALLFEIININNYIGTDNYESALCYNEATKDNIAFLKEQKNQQIKMTEENAKQLTQQKREEAKKKSEEAQKKIEQIKKEKKEKEKNEASSGSNSTSGTSSTSSNSNKKVMLITGHSPNSFDSGAASTSGLSESKRTRELALVIESELKKYVDVSIFNRDVLGDDLVNYTGNISATQYFGNCESGSIRYSQQLCEKYSQDKNTLKNQEYDFSAYSYVLELHFNDVNGTFITAATNCSDASSKSCMVNETKDAVVKIANKIMEYIPSTGISYNTSSNNGIRDDWYMIERYIRNESNVPASLIEVSGINESFDNTAMAKAITRGIVEGLDLTWTE